jgi:hypothetical protein
MSQSQYSQQELDLDTWWLQTGWEGSDVLGSADAYAPSLSNWLVEANQGGDTIQSPEAGYHDGEPANDGSIGSGYPQSGGGLASVAFDNSTQAGSMVWQIQDWSVTGRSISGPTRSSLRPRSSRSPTTFTYASLWRSDFTVQERTDRYAKRGKGLRSERERRT